MPNTDATLYFDFVDPLSFLLERALSDAAAKLTLVFHPFELRPPPTPLVEIDAESPRWSLARELAEGTGLSLAPPRLVPWTRKAHELHLFAAEHAVDSVARRAIFEAYLLDGRDIGRVDVLVDIGRSVGLDASETKAVLDVDRLDAAVVAARARATAAGARDTPTALVGSRLLEGFHNCLTLGTLQRDP